MPKYKVTANSHLVVKKNAETGLITERTRYRRGDEVTLSEADAERLLRTGGLVPVEDYAEPEEVEPEATDLGPQPGAAPTQTPVAEGEVTGGGSAVEENAAFKADDADAEGVGSLDENEEEREATGPTVEQIEAMEDYAAMQDLARQWDLPYNGVSKAALRASLVEHVENA